MWRKGNPSTLLMGMLIGAAAVENSKEVFQKAKNRTALWPSSSIPGCISEDNENTGLKRYTHPSVHNSIIYSSHETEAT